MKKIVLFVSVAVLLLCTTCSSDEYKNKGHFKRNIPACVKQTIEECWIGCADEYCSIDNTKKIYCFLPPPSFPAGGIWYDENCNIFLVDTEEYPIIVTDPNAWTWGYLLPDGTIEYKEDIYHFKRTVFKQK